MQGFISIRFWKERKFGCSTHTVLSATPPGWGFLNAAAFDGDLFVHRDNLLLEPPSQRALLRHTRHTVMSLLSLFFWNKTAFGRIR